MMHERAVAIEKVNPPLCNRSRGVEPKMCSVHRKRKKFNRAAQAFLELLVGDGAGRDGVNGGSSVTNGAAL